MHAQLQPYLQVSPLQVEEKALEKEKDKQSKARLGEVQRELSELQDKLKPLQMRYRCVTGCTLAGF